MSNRNLTLVIPTELLAQPMIEVLQNVAQDCGIAYEWPNNALLFAIDPAVGDHRAFMEQAQARFETHVRK